ncbi:MAG: hypothetical protein DME32_15445 [Verrucomicrobia bacterium]|nr:MAG: hypothetical protein DME32_15445 [Verrucomicrobiota bacterium]
MKGALTTPTQMRVARFITDRCASRAQPDYSSELITFGVIVLAISCSMFILAGAMAGMLK